MTELAIMQHAKSYLDQLAEGIDPITGEPAPAGDVICSERLSRCFRYVSGVLQRVIENGGEVAAPVKKSGMQPFCLSEEERARYPLEDWPVTVSVIAQKLNTLADGKEMRRLKTASITAFFLQSGFLAEEILPTGSHTKRPTAAGRDLGISTALRTGQNGEYTAVVYSREAQRFLLDNLDAVQDINARPLHENQGKPWEPTEDDYLRRSFRDGTEVKEMSAELKRTRGAIRARLEKLGLVKMD